MIARLILWIIVTGPLAFVTALFWLSDGLAGLMVPLGALAAGAAAYIAQDRWRAHRQRRALASLIAALPAEGEARGEQLTARQREVAARWGAISEDAKLDPWTRARLAAKHALGATIAAYGALGIIAALIYWLGLRLSLAVACMFAARLVVAMSFGGVLVPLPALYMAALSLWRREVIQPAQQAHALRVCAAELDTLATLAGGLSLADHELDDALRGALSAQASGQLEQAAEGHDEALA